MSERLVETVHKALHTTPEDYVRDATAPLLARIAELEKDLAEALAARPEEKGKGK